MSSGDATGTCILNAGKSKRTRLRRAHRQRLGCPCGGSKKLVSSMFRVVGRQGARGVAAHARALLPQHRSLFLSSPLLKAKAPQGSAQRAPHAPRNAKSGAQGASQRHTSPRQGTQPQHEGHRARLQKKDSVKQGRRGNVPSPKNWARPDQNRPSKSTRPNETANRAPQRDAQRDTPNQSQRQVRKHEISLPPMISVVNLARVLGVNMRTCIADLRYASISYGKDWTHGRTTRPFAQV